MVRTEAGKTVNLREALVRKLVGLQKIDPKTGAGYWVNEEGRWWEQDPVLVTSYALIALEIAAGHVAQPRDDLQDALSGRFRKSVVLASHDLLLLR